LKKYENASKKCVGTLITAWQPKVTLAKSSRAAKGLTVGDFSP